MKYMYFDCAFLKFPRGLMRASVKFYAFEKYDSLRIDAYCILSLKLISVAEQIGSSLPCSQTQNIHVRKHFSANHDCSRRKNCDIFPNI